MYTLDPLPFAFNALEPFIDATTMEIHHDRHHATYIKNVNDALATIAGYTEVSIEELITNLDTIPEALRTKVRNNAGGHFNHRLFWSILSPAAGQTAEGSLHDAIVKSFGDLMTLQKKINDAGLARFGSGWVWLVVDKKELKVMDTPNQDSPFMDGIHPILGIDVWEHAYYLKYQNKRADYLTAFWNVVNWREVEKLYASAMS